MAITGYVEENEIVKFLNLINPDFEACDVDENIVNAMYELINSKMSNVYEEETELLADGTGDRFFYSPKIPIVEVTRVAKVNTDETEEDFDISGSDRNIWWDYETGRFWTLKDDEYGIEYGYDLDSVPIFPDRPKSIKLEGTFGVVASALVKQLQLLLILKQYSLLQPSNFASDIIQEKIGRYSYKLANASNVEPENQRKGLDGWIAYLFKELPLDNTFGIESI